MNWVANNYDCFQRQFQFEYGSSLLSTLESFVDLRNKSILDLGCGTGDLALLLQEKAGFSGCVTVIDKDPGMLRVLRSKRGSEDLTVVESDIVEWLRSAENQFDVVFSNATLHWLNSYPQLDFVLSSCRDRLPCHGHIAFRFSLRGNCEQAKLFLENSLRDYLAKPELTLWRSIFEFDQCVNLIEKNNFKVTFADDLTYSPFDDDEMSYSWMVNSQPNLKYLDEDELDSFRQFLWSKWSVNQIKVGCHHGVFIAEAI